MTPVHDEGCLAASVREARCGCSRSDWLREAMPRGRARAEVFHQISRWAAEKTRLAEGHIRDSLAGLSVFEAEARRACARMAAVMYVEFGNMARTQAAECERIEQAKPAQAVKRAVVDVELPPVNVAEDEGTRSKCGTYGGCLVHYRRGEKPCSACMNTQNHYCREWRIRTGRTKSARIPLHVLGALLEAAPIELEEWVEQSLGDLVVTYALERWAADRAEREPGGES